MDSIYRSRADSLVSGLIIYDMTLGVIDFRLSERIGLGDCS